MIVLENRQDEATATYKILEQDVPDNPRVLNNLAWSLKDSDPVKGVEYAQKADKLDPDNPLIMDTLAILLLIIGSVPATRAGRAQPPPAKFKSAPLYSVAAIRVFRSPRTSSECVPGLTLV